jgi:3-hydroxybutyryl-CoA dehydratase
MNPQGGCYFEDIAVGDEAVQRRTVTEADILAFAAASGDFNPVHFDEDFARSTPFAGRIAHGMLSASHFSALLGMRLPGPGAIYLSQSLAFKRPVRIGDTVSARVRVIAIDEAKARVTLACVAEVGGKTVIDGEAVVMAPRKPA